MKIERFKNIAEHSALMEPIEMPIVPRPSDPEVDSLTSILARQPDNRIVRERLALVYDKRHEFQKAAEQYRALLAQDPENPFYKNKLGLNEDFARREMAEFELGRPL